MAITYSLQAKKGLVLLENASAEGSGIVEIVTPEEFAHLGLGNTDVDADTQEALAHLAETQGSFANLLPDCIIGSLAFIERDDLLSQPKHFGFYLTKDKLVFIDTCETCKHAVGSLRELSALPTLTTGRVLFELMKHNVENDPQFLTALEQQMSDIEEMIIDDYGEVTNQDLLGFRRKMLKLNRYYQQLTDMAELISKDEFHQISKDDRHLFRLFSQLTNRLFQRTQYMKEYSLQLRELYQMEMDYKQNKTIQWLTVVTTLVVPLMLITSWYGMNFKNMPELNWPYSYFVVMAVCIVIIIVQLVFFKKRKWL